MQATADQSGEMILPKINAAFIQVTVVRAICRHLPSPFNFNFPKSRQPRRGVLSAIYIFSSNMRLQCMVQAFCNGI